MIDRLLNIVGHRDFVPSLLQAVLLIIFLFILFLIPTFEIGTELAVFSATLAIVILSLLSAHYSEERTVLLREQNELMESQITALEGLEGQTREQTDFFQELNNNEDDDEADGDVSECEEDEEPELEKETTD